MSGFESHLDRQSPLLKRILAAIPEGQAVYLVGGAVRDLFLQRFSHDLDFALPGDALKVARQVGDSLGAAFFPLDVERDTGRVVLTEVDGRRFILDFTRFRGPSLESDLRRRDLTINALALDLRSPAVLIDPLGGLRDLREGVLKPCSPEAFSDDPLRVLRAIRMAAALEFHIPEETRSLIRQAMGGLPGVSPERVRDEVFHLLESGNPATGVLLLDYFGALEFTLPELLDLKGIRQPPPHIHDAWTHSLGTVRELERVLGVLGPVHDEETSADLTLGVLVQRLGRYRERVSAHLEERLSPERSLHALLILAALYHDAGKPQTMEVEESGRIRFGEHPKLGAEIAGRRARWLCLSNREADRLGLIVAHHMRPLFLANGEQPPTRRAVYRFFRHTGAAGVDICLLSLADTLATYGPTLDQGIWLKQLDTVRALLEAWWEQRDTSVDPVPLLGGKDLIEELGMEPGLTIGRLLEYLREAQATGLIHTRAEALAVARKWLSDQDQG